MGKTSEQKKWLQGFSRVGFLFPWIYLLRARQYLFAIIIYIVPIIVGYFVNNSILSFGIWLIVAIVVGVKGRKLAFDKTKKSYENFKEGYRKSSKVIIIVFFSIFIIGILAAALIPRSSNARGRANDVARKADLAQVASAIVSYQIDNGSFPTTVGALSRIKDKLLSAGMSGIPSDPNTSRYFDGIAVPITGQYSYTSIKKGGVNNGGFVLMAATETVGGSNRVQGTTEGKITSADDYNAIKLCTKFTEGAAASQPTNDDAGNCVYDKNGDQLRYIYLY